MSEEWEEDQQVRPRSRLLVWSMRVGFVLAAALVALTFVNASWRAPVPKGDVKLIAHRGIAQQFDGAGSPKDGCIADKIEPPVHKYVENTVRSLERVTRIRPGMIDFDVAITADGQVVLFSDATLDCRTNGTGPVNARTLVELQALDAGYGYTADGGKTFPLRAGPGNRIPPLVDALRLFPRAAIMFHFRSDDPRQADVLAEALRASGRDVAARHDAFFGPPATIARIAELFPENWAWSAEAADRCSGDYVRMGWTGMLPESCKGGTLVIPLDQQWKFWGWPNNLIARMEEAGGRVVVTGPESGGQPYAGINLPEQLGEIPSTFNGYVWVDDIWVVGPALFPSFERRKPAEINDALDGLKRRRER